MPANTPNRALSYPLGGDNVSAYPSLAQTLATALDFDMKYTSGLAANIPAAGSVPTGTGYLATDTNVFSVNTGSAWVATTNGPAGGDLGGTYPNPTVLVSRGAAGGDLGGTYPNPTVLVSRGAAGGDLGGTYPNPTITAAAFGAASHLTFAAPAKGYRNAALSMATGWNKIGVETASFNPGGAFDVVTNNRYNVPATGYYQVNGEVTGTMNASSGLMTVGVYRNGGLSSLGNQVSVTFGTSYSFAVSDVLSCAAADYLELWHYNGSSNGVTLTVGSSSSNYLSVVRVA